MPHAYECPVAEVLARLEVDLAIGLESDEAARRLQQHGANALSHAQAKSGWRILVDQLKSLVVALLAAAALVSFAFEEWTEGAAITVVIFLNALIGFVIEMSAVRSMEALRSLGDSRVSVRRNGRLYRLSATELVLGDIVVLEASDVVCAALRLITAFRLEADESTLTGESLPIVKGTQPLESGNVLAERVNMVHRGTSITLGAGEGVVGATGMATELGCISALVQAAAEPATTLQQRLDRMASRLVWLVLAIGAMVLAIGIVGGKPVFLMIETGIALAIAAIPPPPPREAVKMCREEGIRVVMVTGDQPETARWVAHAVDLVDDGESAVVHGRDLVTDPAMAETARAAADMVLRADSFATIVDAVKHGRVIFRNNFLSGLKVRDEGARTC